MEFEGQDVLGASSERAVYKYVGCVVGYGVADSAAAAAVDRDLLSIF